MIFCAPALYAQVGANLSGTVKDLSGALIPNATVTITNLATNETRTLQTGAQGEYRVVNLQPAQYTINVVAAGFGSTKKAVELIVGSELTSDMVLGNAGTADVITVQAGGADVLLETTKSQPSAVIDSRQPCRASRAES